MERGSVDINCFPLTLNEEAAANMMFTWLSQFAILTEAKRTQFQKIFTYYDKDNDERITPAEAGLAGIAASVHLAQMAKALQVVNENLITPQQIEYVMSILEVGKSIRSWRTTLRRW